MLTGDRKSRRSYEEVVDAIMEVLPVRYDTNINKISMLTDIAWETVWRWLKIIVYIQGLPRVKVTKSPTGRGEVYRREMKR